MGIYLEPVQRAVGHLDGGAERLLHQGAVHVAVGDHGLDETVGMLGLFWGALEVARQWNQKS